MIGLGEDGQYHYYIPDSGDLANYVTKLANGDVEAQVLGADSYPNPWWVGASTDSGGFAWLLGLAGLAAGVSSGGDLGESAPTSSALIESSINGTAMSVNESGHPVVTGQVVDANGNVLANATVSAILTLPDGRTEQQEVQTQEDGSFALEWAMLNLLNEGLPYLHVDLSAFKVGYSKASVQIDSAATNADAEGVKIEPKGDAAKLEIEYIDENGDKQIITAIKENGVWTATENGVALPNQVSSNTPSIDKTTGVVSIPVGQIQEGAVSVVQTTNDGASVQTVQMVSLADSTEQAIADALAKVKAAEAKEAEAQAIVDNADTNNDGILSQNEAEAIKDALAAKNAEVEQLKKEADAAVKALPAGATDGQSPANTKDSLQTRVDNVNPVAAPSVNDANNDGVIDTPSVTAISIDADQDNNGGLNSSELTAAKGVTDVTITLSDDVALGDSISYTIGSEATVTRLLTTDEIAAKAVIINKVNLPTMEGDKLEVSANISATTRTGVTPNTQVQRDSAMYDAVSNAPIGKDQLVVATEDVAYTFGSDDFSLGMTDPLDTADSFAGIKIESVAKYGSLFLDKNADGVFNTGDTMIAVGNVISSNDLSMLTYLGKENYSGTDSFTFKVMDSGSTDNGGSNTATNANIMHINVQPVTDAVTADRVTFDGAPKPITGSVTRPADTGWWQTSYQITKQGTLLNSNVIKSAAGLESTIEELILSSSKPLENRGLTALTPELAGYRFDPSTFKETKTGGNQSVANMKDKTNEDGILAGQGQKTSGLIYLEKGQTAKFRYFADDYIQISLGGKILTQDSSGWDTTYSEGYTVTESGYYSVEIFVYNLINGSKNGQVGAQVVQLSTDGGTNYKEINTTNFDLYKNAADLFTANQSLNPELKRAEGATADGGYYTTTKYTNIGYVDDATQKSSATKLAFDIQSKDQDGSETLTAVKLSFDKLIAQGVTLSDNTGKSYTFKGVIGEEIDVTNWSLDNLTLGAGVDAGAYVATVKTTWQDSAKLYEWDDASATTTGNTQATDNGVELSNTFNVNIYNNVIDLADQKNELQITLSDLVANTNLSKLYITGGSTDTVDLGRNGTVGNTASGFADGTGSWIKGAVVTDAFGTHFDTYKHNGNSNEILYIQQGINVL